MPGDDLAKACQKVGRFLRDFALLEQEIDARIIDMLQLQDIAAAVVAKGIDLAKKVNLLRTVAVDATQSEKKKKNVEMLFSKIYNLNQARVMMAHSFFEPTDNEGVQFFRTTAKDGKVRREVPLWTKDKFDEASKELHTVRNDLSTLRPALTYKILDDRPKLLQAYFYPMSEWVPTPP